MENQGSSNQSRFLIAAALSMAVLFGWQYFFAPKPAPLDANSNANVAQSATPTPAPAPTVQQVQSQPDQAQADTTPQRSITIKSPLYEVTLDSKGAVATSW